MNDIRSLLTRAARRLEMTRFVASLHIVAIAAAAIALMLALIDRAPADSMIAWRWVAPGLAVIAILTALLLWRRRRLTETQVALAVDERLDLRERISTAMHVHDRQDAFAQAAVADAIDKVRDPRTRELVDRRFRVSAPSLWWITPLILVVTGGVLLMPQANLFAAEVVATDGDLTDATKRANQQIEALKKTIDQQDILKSELEADVDDLLASPSSPDNLRRPEQVKRDALKKVTQLSKKLDDIINGEKGKTAKALKEMLSKVSTPESGPAKELAEALANGNFDEAKKALDKLAEEMQNGQMNEAQKQQLAEQMQQIGDQLNQLAQQQQQLKAALQQAGLPPQLANNPQALQQALQNAQNLNEQQKQQIQQMMQAQQAAQQMCQGLGEACQKMGQAGQQGAQGMKQAAGQLGEMEQLEQLLQQAQAAMGQCQGQQGLNQNMGQMSGGMGKRGQGAGRKAPMSKTPTGTKLVKADTPIGDGEIIASMLIDGTPITGESRAKLRDVVESQSEGYDEAGDEDPVPARYRDVHQHYFGELQKRVEAVTIETDADADPAPAAAEEPADE